MSTPTGGKDAARGDGAAAPRHEPAAEEPESDASGNADAAAEQESAEQQVEADDVAEHTWDSRRDLYRHSPGIMFGRSAQLGGSVVGGDQHGVSGGHVTGDVLLGGTKHETKYEYHFGSRAEETSGEIPASEVEELAAYFVYPAGPHDDDPDRSCLQLAENNTPWDSQSSFGEAVSRLHERGVVVLSGPAATGRGSAGLMLLRAVGAVTYRTLDSTVSPGRLSGELHDNCGHLIANFTNNADRPLREHHLRALSEKLKKSHSHLVIVVGPHPVVEGDCVSWQPPQPDEILRGHLKHKELRGRSVDELLALPAVQSVLGHRRPVAELARFAEHIAKHARGELSAGDLAKFGYYAAEQQVRQWFDGTDQTLHDKAFLISLAAFDEAPYPLTAELSDVLYVLLQRIEDRGKQPRIPVFGTSSAQRVELAQADRYQEVEDSEWGPVPQTKIQFRDRLTAITLLREVWTGHPSARPAVTEWLRQLAVDPRPVVRNRAASTAAVLAEADLLSTMALLIQPWAADRRFRARLAAANALALAHYLEAPHVPRMLHTWCTAEDHRLRWTAVRAYGLVGETFPGRAVAALVDAVRAVEARGGVRDAWPEEIDDIAQSAAVLLLAASQNGAGEDESWQAAGPEGEGGSGSYPTARRGTGDTASELWTALVPLLREQATRTFVLRTVVHACGPTDGEPGTGRPLLLDIFARARSTPGTPGALLRQSLAALWRAVLNDPVSARSGLGNMRDWVRAAAFDPDAERALAQLLPMLVVAGEDANRLAYLLDRLRGGDTDHSIQAVAKRLRPTVQPGGRARPMPGAEPSA